MESHCLIGSMVPLLNSLLHSYALKVLLHRHEWGLIVGLGHCAKESKDILGGRMDSVEGLLPSVNGHILLLRSE